MINLSRIIASLPKLAQGALITLEISFGALIIGFTIGTMCGIMLHRNEPGSWLVRMYVGLLRGTPMLIQIAFFYYVLSMMGLGLSALTCAIIAIGLNSSAYITEVIRSGVASVDQGQIDAAYTLGIPQSDITRSIILPQAIRTVLPALGNEIVTLVKDSSLASVIGVMELYNQGRSIISTTYDPLSMYVAIAIMYLCITTAISYIMQYIEYRMRHIC